MIVFVYFRKAQTFESAHLGRRFLTGLISFGNA